MRSRLFHRAVALLLLGLLALGLAPAPLGAAGFPAQALRRAERLRVRPSAALPEPRAGHTATALANGRVLIVGGERAIDDMTAGVLIVNPKNGRIRAAAPLSRPRVAHTATLLRDGRVLVVGGYNAAERWLPDAEIYNPKVDTWTAAPPLYHHGSAHTATLLADGRVLVVGGCIGDGVCTARAEIFDPQTGCWTEAAALGADRAGHTATLLEGGEVLVAGGWGAFGEPADGAALRYDPQADRWTPTGPMQAPTFAGEALRLPDGRVLVAGGIAWPLVNPITISAAAAIYDPATDTWADTAPMATPRYAFQLQLLNDGRAVAIGGVRDDLCCWNERSPVGAIERYNAGANRWEEAGSLPAPTAFAAAAALPDGRIWLTGGRNHTGFLPDTWLIGAR